MRRTILFCTIGSLLLVSPARAQSWVDSVFPERSYDFGTVAKGSKVRHSFRVVNRLNQDVNIADWETKCGCTDVRVGARLIPPGAQTTVEATIDTSRFVGHKPSGLTLVLDRPSPARLELNLSCFIRADITVTPGLVDFQSVERSATTKPTVSLNLAYSGGMHDWGVIKMHTRTANVAAKLKEQSRSADGQVQYALNVTLDPAGLNGFFKDEILLYTNDSTTPTIPISVVANIRSALTVSPSNLILGPVKAGQVVEKTLLVRASQPFKLTGVKPSKDDFTTTPEPDPDTARAVHTVKIKFKAPSKPGAYNAAFEIATDLKDEPPARLTTFATILP